MSLLSQTLCRLGLHRIVRQWTEPVPVGPPEDYFACARCGIERLPWRLRLAESLYRSVP